MQLGKDAVRALEAGQPGPRGSNARGWPHTGQQANDDRCGEMGARLLTARGRSWAGMSSAVSDWTGKSGFALRVGNYRYKRE